MNLDIRDGRIPKWEGGKDFLDILVKKIIVNCILFIVKCLIYIWIVSILGFLKNIGFIPKICQFSKKMVKVQKGSFLGYFTAILLLKCILNFEFVHI